MTLMEHLTRIVTLLRAAIGAQLNRQLRPPQPVPLGRRVYLPLFAPPRRPALPEPVWSLLYLRLGRMLARVQALYGHWRAGTLPQPRAPRPRPEHPRRDPPRAPAALRLPRGFAWANLRLPEAAPASGFLDHLLHNEPEARHFIAAAPRAARLLRPLCQALGIRPPAWLRLPPRPPAPRRPRPRREPRPRLTDPRLGLQPYVIAAARHAKKFDPAA